MLGLRRGAKRTGTKNGEPSAAAHDLAWAVVVCVLVAALAIQSRVLDHFVRFAASGNANGVLAILFLVPIAATVFSMRRYRESERAQGELARLSMHDSLTGLPNRRFLTERFKELLRRVSREGGRIGVFFLDLDKFKGVNDTYGHEVGDQLMVAVTARITNALGPQDHLIRYGGDEFVAICPNVTSHPVAEKHAKRLIDALEQPFAMGQDRIRISVSIGVALTEEHCSEPEDVIRDADAAMYQAKAEGSGSFAIFDRSMPDRITPSTAERKLNEALEKSQFILHYQPVVSLQSGRMVKVEALVRWEDPERGLVPPGEFIPALEDTGLIVPVGTWILGEACRQARAWQDRYPNHPPLVVTVNVSARQLAQYDFNEVLTRTVSDSGVDPARIALEITEGALMYDVDTAWSHLRHAKNLGLALALDDFGTGFSSLSFLRRFALDIVKIDKSFVDGLGQSREDTTIVQHVIGMARGLGIVTVAEGVETPDQVRYLQSLECQMAQGYYYCSPQPPAVIDQIIQQLPDGDSSEGQPPTGQPPTGQPPTGQLPDGQPSNGQFPDGQPSNGRSLNGQSSPQPAVQTQVW